MTDASSFGRYNFPSQAGTLKKMELDTDFVRDALAHLRKRDHRPQTPAALSHRYRVGEALSESEISAVEREYSFVTPRAYRTFLQHVGNGGAGPQWGLLPFGRWPAPDGPKAWREVFPGWSPGQPFALTASWNEPESFFEQEPDYGAIPESEHAAAEGRWESQLLHYWREQILSGAIPIAEVGCGIFEWLVVTGPETGNIWVDSRSDYRGVFPLTRDGEHVSFEAWYVSWLNECLDAVALRKRHEGWLRGMFGRR